MPFTHLNAPAQLQLDEGEKSRPTKGIDMTQNTVPDGHPDQFRAAEAWCIGRCDCWRCARQIILVMPDALAAEQRGEINARMTAAFDALVAEMVRHNKAEAVTR